MIKNQLHAETTEAEPNERSLKRLEERLLFMNKQEKEIKQDISEIIQQDKTVEAQISYMTSIPGVSVLTAATILGETNGFELIRNKRQLTSYAGFDVKEKLSGTSVHGKPKISKRGNKYLRKCLHLPSLCSVKYILEYRELYTRIVSKNGIKLKALIAVQRKMLELTYVLVKNQAVYNPNYEMQKRVPLKEENTLTS